MAVWSFMREFARHPAKLGAVAPSGEDLARRTVEAAQILPGHVVVELGAGTGPMTAQIVTNYPRNPFHAVEPNPKLAQKLRDKYPEVPVAETYAQDLPELVAAWGHPQVDRIVSGLPFAIWPGYVQEACFHGICDALADDGRMVTFTYVHAQMLPAAKRLRERLRHHFGSVRKSRVTWANLPPAFVFVCDEPLRR